VPTGRQYLSDQALCILGQAPDQPIEPGLPSLALIHPDDLPALQARVSQLYAAHGAPTARMECRVRRTDGTIRWVDIRAAVDRDADGKALKIRGSVLDITQQRQANAALGESETKLRAIFESSTDAIGVSARGVHILFNPAYLAMFGYAAEELYGKPVLDLIAPEARADIAQKMRARAAGGVVANNYETRGLRKDGSSFDMDVRVSTYELNNEQNTLVLLRDISEQKQAQEALRLSEQLFRQLAENVNEVMWVRDYASGAIEYVNPAYERVWGRSRESLYKDPSTFADEVYPPDAETFRAALHRQYAGHYLNMQLRLVRPDGELRWVRIHSYPVTGETGSIFRLVGIAEDITERKQQEELNELEQRRLKSVLKLSQMPRASTQQLVDAAAEEIQQLCGSPHGLIIYMDDKQIFSRGLAAAHLESAASPRLPASQLWDDAIQQGKTLLLNDLRDAPANFDGLHLPGGQAPMHRLLLLPVKQGESVLGVAAVANKPADYTQLDINQLNLMMEECVKIFARARAEERLQASLDEKNALLKEIHHRVKNNMQVMISLLQMQARQVDEERIRAMFYECKDRIYSMALVHEQLYGSNNLAQIQFGDYLERLVHDLHGTYNITGRIRLEMRIQPVTLPIELAVPCGLMINEMVTNAYKHAFPGGRAGVVSASLNQQGGEITLTIGDDGVGMPAGVAPEKVDSLGLKLIHLLARQVGGALTLERENGTRFILRFPLAS